MIKQAISSLVIFIAIFVTHMVAHTEISELTKKAMQSPPEKEIKFYYHTMPYYEFTNFWLAPVNIDNKIWPSTEHYYQAQKFIGPHEDIQEKIRLLPTPSEVYKLANSRNGTEKDKIRKDWNEIMVDVMRKAVRAKFEQHPDLMKVLKSTGNSLLIEYSKNDGFWGVANKDRTGYSEVTPLNDWLGKLLMEIRDGKQIYNYNPNDYKK